MESRTEPLKGSLASECEQTCTHALKKRRLVEFVAGCVCARPRASLHLQVHALTGRGSPTDERWTRMCVHGSVCHSGIKFMNAVRRSQTEELC